MNDKQKHIWLPLIVSLVATIIGGAVADGLYNLWPGFWAFFGVLIYSVLGLGLVLAVHNIYYHATFHTLSYFIHYVTKDTEGALKSLQRINHIRPNDPYPLIQQALILLKQKNLSDALSTVDRAQLLVGERYDVLELRKEILWQLGQRQDSLHLDTWKDVAETLEKMIRIAKDKEDLHYQLAEVYFYLGKYKRGISKLTRLITRLMENAKSLEDKSQFSAAERKMWIAVDVQKNSIAILEKAIPNIQTTVSEYPPGLLVYLDKLTDALHKIKVFSAGTIEACYSLADIYLLVGENKIGISILKNLTGDIIDEVKLYENKVPDFARGRLWSAIEVQQKEIALLKRMLLNSRSMKDVVLDSSQIALLESLQQEDQENKSET